MAVEETESEGGYLHFVDASRGEIELLFWSEDVLRVCTAAQNSHYPIERAGIWADAVRLGRPVVHNDYQGLPDHAKGGLPEGHFVLHRHLAIPVVEGSDPRAILGVGNKVEPYDEADVAVATTFAEGLWSILRARRSVGLEREVEIDPLTGVLRRRAFDERLSREWDRARRRGTSLVLLMVDIDHFKRFNDSVGHLAGDRVLERIGAILRECFSRAADSVGRFGGEEFVVLVPDADCGDAPGLAERLRSAVEAAEIAHPDSPVSPWVTVSVGTSHAARPMGSDTRALVREADVALYEAKHRGRNQVVLSCADGLHEGTPRPAGQ